MSAGDERLAEALRAEHAAIFGYGTIGAHLDKASVNAAVNAEAAHRARRDALLIRLSRGGAVPPAPEPAYAMPFAVTDRTTALRLAVTIEERVAAIWRLALSDTAGDDRTMALEALLDCATRATRLRLTAGVSPATVALPGAPTG